MTGIGYHAMRDTGFGTFTSSPFELSDVLAFKGDFGSADRIIATVGKSFIGVDVEAFPQSVGVCVTGLGAELPGGHFEVVADQCVEIEFFFGFCLGQCGITVLVNARYS